MTETNPPTGIGPESPVLHRTPAAADQTALPPLHMHHEDATHPFLRHWKLIVLPALAAMLFAWLIAVLQPDRYRASAIAAVSPMRQGLQPNEVLRGVEVLERRTVIATVAALASTPLTLRQTLGANAQGMRVTAAVLPNTNLFRIDVEGPNPAAVATAANRIPELLSAQTRSMFSIYSVTTVSAAAAPTEPYAPRAGRAALAGLLVGALIGMALTYAMHALRAR